MEISKTAELLVMPQESSMVTGEGFIAKIVTSITGKAASTLMSLVLDKRRKACRTLVKLYHAIVSLDETTEDFLTFATASAHNSSASGLLAAVRSFAHLFEVPSNAFIDLSRELKEGLMIIDPTLARSLEFLYYGKDDFLSFLSCSIETREVEGKMHLVIYRPNEKILNTDFEYAYHESLAANQHGETYYWPAGAFDYFRDFEEFDISTASEDAAKALVEMIRLHHQQLKQAGEALRSLLVRNFTVEELLFQPKRKNN
jgi:hypothetical protein